MNMNRKELDTVWAELMRASAARANAAPADADSAKARYDAIAARLRELSPAAGKVQVVFIL